MGRKGMILALLVVMVCCRAVQADIVALKRSPELTAGTRLDARFATPISNGTIQVVSGPGVAGDTHFWTDTGWAAQNCYMNYGASPSTSSFYILTKFNVGALPSFQGSRINKAQLRLYHTGGNTGLGKTGYIISSDWAEGTGSSAGQYPGTAGGASFAHPQGHNTGNLQNTNAGTTPPLKSWANDDWFGLKDVSSEVATLNTPHNAGADFAVYDVTAFVQLWAYGTPNYGFCTYDASCNYTVQLSETTSAATYQPVLCIDYDQNGAPNGMTNLAVASVDWFRATLQWTAPSDVPAGPVARYEIRYSMSPITDDASFAAGIEIIAPAPASPGTVQTVTVTGLSPLTTYYFGIKCYDIMNLSSPLSNNPVSVTTLEVDPIAPEQMNSLAATNIKPNYVTLTWTAVADDGANPASGLAAGYDLRYSTLPISSDADFAEATAVAGLPAPQAAGATETFTVYGLTPSTTYYFAIKARDEVPNWSALGTSLTLTTLAEDLTPPPAVMDLAVATALYNAAYLTCTAPADIGTAGLGGYDLRYSTSPIDENNWDSAIQVTGEPVPVSPGESQSFLVTGLSPNTLYYFAVKSFDEAAPANMSALSNVPSTMTPPPIVPVTVTNPWLTNDRVADTRNINTMAATYVNAYTPDGVVPSTDTETKAINVYNNQKRRLYHWADEPPGIAGNNIDDPTYTQNVFGWCLCGRHAAQACTITNTAGIPTQRVGIQGHWIYEVQYNGKWHVLDTMTTMYVYDKGNPRQLIGCSDYRNDATLMTGAYAEGRACPGFLLCGDTAQWFVDATRAQYSPSGNGVVTTRWNGNMGLRLGQSYKRTWESWINQHPTGTTVNDSFPGIDPPYHHDSGKGTDPVDGRNLGDDADTVNYPYWEPYTLNSTQNAAISIGHSKTYRRWANGTDTLAPNFRTPGYQAMIHSSSGIGVYGDDYISPDLHVATVGTTANAVFKIDLPFHITDCNISGDFVKTNTGDICKVYYSPDATTWTQVYDAPIGTNHVTNLNLRTNLFGTNKYGPYGAYYIKVEIKASVAKSDAGVSNLAIVTTFQHNKGAMAYLDKGINNLTLTFDNAAQLQASRNVLHVVYKWKEYGGTDWNIDKRYDGYFSASPATFTIDVGGTKVPRTEYILMEVIEPILDPVPPGQILDLAQAGAAGSARVPLTWTATGDDGSTGTAMAYDLRYSTSPITDDASFNAATATASVPAPKVAGSAESFTAMYLPSSTTLYFAIKAIDKGGNRGPLSNVITVTTAAAVGVTDLTAGTATSAKVPLTWTAIDDGSTGTCASYDLRYSTSPISDDASFNAATQVTGLPAPKAAGQAESFSVSYLDASTTYYFAIKGIDAKGNASPLSNLATATTLAAPSVNNLATGSPGASRMPLTWTAIDDGVTGRFTSYNLRYSTNPITDDATFNAATAAADVPAPGAAGQAESFTVTGLSGNTMYYFALKAVDAQGRSSLLSNIVSATTTIDTVAPQWIGSLKGMPSHTANAVDLTWTAPADYADGGAGPYTCASYQLRYSTSPILYNDGGASWDAATVVAGLPAPKTPGTLESVTVIVPGGGATYYFAIKVSDDANPANISEVSNCAMAKSSTRGDIVLQNGTGGYSGCMDTYIDETSNNWASNSRMTICGHGTGNRQRGLLRFDLSSLAGANVTSATLYLWAYNQAQCKGSTSFFGVYPLSHDWTATATNWTNYASGTGWSTPGGDFGSSPDATCPKMGAASIPAWYSWNVTSRVQSWLAGTSTNYGWLVKCVDEALSLQDQVYQSETGDTAHRPKLVVSDVQPRKIGDINGDNYVNVGDLQMLIYCWATEPTVRGYEPWADFDGNEYVNIGDLQLLILHWNQ